jgi:hypothetical protein
VYVIKQSTWVFTQHQPGRKKGESRRSTANINRGHEQFLGRQDEDVETFEYQNGRLAVRRTTPV